MAFAAELRARAHRAPQLDGGSSDGTPDIVREASLRDGDDAARLAQPAHHPPDQRALPRPARQGAAALRDALRGRRPAAGARGRRARPGRDEHQPRMASPGSLRPVLADGFDFVSPVYSRHPLDGPLVTQLVRPLVRAAYGLAPARAAGGRVRLLGALRGALPRRQGWETTRSRARASTSGSRPRRRHGALRVGEARLGPAAGTCRARSGHRRTRAPGPRRALHQPAPRRGGLDRARRRRPRLALRGARADPAARGSGRRRGGSLRISRRRPAALEPILARALEPATLEAVRAAAAASAAELSDELWVTVVDEIAAAHRKASLSRDHLGQAAVPLYLGRVAAFHAAHAGDPAHVVEQALEELCLRFERSRPELVRLWTAAAR